MGELHVLDHPLIQHKLTVLRDVNTPFKQFRETLAQITSLMCYEVTRKLPTEEKQVQTPLTTASFPVLACKAPVIVPILRAGLGMVEPFLQLLPEARVGHIGLSRDEETHMPIKYYCKMPPDVQDSPAFIVDPMLATGGSASDAITFVKEYGCTNITLVDILSAPEGIAKVQKDHPDVDIFVAAVDDGLNDRAYIVPGLGDAGDRIFGTK